jgi:hypothetical protein
METLEESKITSFTNFEYIFFFGEISRVKNSLWFWRVYPAFKIVTFDHQNPAFSILWF